MERTFNIKDVDYLKGVKGDTEEGESFTIGWTEFSADNAEDEEVLELVGALAVGESVMVGGGAQPLTTIARLV